VAVSCFEGVAALKDSLPLEGVVVSILLLFGGGGALLSLFLFWSFGKELLLDCPRVPALEKLF
jgi:hypothetical protein